MRQGKYDKIRRIRISDDTYEKLCSLRKILELSWTETMDFLIEQKERFRIVGQIEPIKQEIVGQKIRKELEITQDIFNEFYKFNPGINFGNKTFRRAAEWLIEKHGKDRVLDVIRFISKIRGSQYAPTITTPYELKEKWAKLEEFALREKNKQETKGLNIGSIT